MEVDFATSTWHFLAFCEDIIVKAILDEGSQQELAAVADNVVAHMKWPLRWLSRKCPQGGRVPRKFDESMYRASAELSALSTEYESFELAYTYASIGTIELELLGNMITASPRFRDDTRYQAYDFLLDAGESVQEADLSLLGEQVASSVRVSGERFEYDLSPEIVKLGLDALAPELSRRCRLPGSWQFTRYQLADFHKVASVLYVLATIHFQARMAAASSGCMGLGYANSVLVMSREEMLRRVVRYTNLDDEVVKALMEDLTYRAGAVRRPDPALQPLVPLTDELLVVSPSLILASDMERNFCVLLNKLPGERAAYSRLSSDRETISQDGVKTALGHLPFRFFHGDIPGWNAMPDVDLAIISDSEKQCLLMQLKSFVRPAEVREVVDRSSEIEDGIKQVRNLRRAAADDAAALRAALRINECYDVWWCVSSDSSVGGAHVQVPDVSVVRTGHLVRRIGRDAGLTGLCDWLAKREYLPVEGVHYEVVDLTAKVGDWTLRWSGVAPLVEGQHF